MKMFKGFLPNLFFLGLFFASVLICAQDDQSGFISIDCGIGKGSSYIDNITGLNYVSDVDFIDSGESHNIMPINNLYVDFTQLTTLRSFPENTRNCYTLKPTQGKGNRYLIRARFMYGNYDFKDKVPEFDVYLGPDYLDTMTFDSSTDIRDMEIILVSSSDYIHVCLVNTGQGTPFISAIELRLLGNDIYLETSFGALYLFRRKTFQNRYSQVRFKADKYDRLWNMFLYSDVTVLSTNDSVYPAPNATNFFPPSAVMSSAITPMYPSNSIHLRWEPNNATDNYFIYMYFAEIELLEDNQIREFNIYLNGNLIYGNFSPQYLTTNILYYVHPAIAAPTYKLEINKTEISTLLPILNALELYTLKQLPQRQTDDQDAGVIWSIKSTYKITKHWQGDPCSLQEDGWDGIGCSYNDTESHRIALLNLSASGLNGEIYPGIANLTKIHTLDLSNNNLTGKVPNFLTGLSFLKVLNLKGNHLIGPIPAELLEKSNMGLLSLSYDGENSGGDASSCKTEHCKNKKGKVILPVVATVASLFVILTALTTTWIIRRQKLCGMKNASLSSNIIVRMFSRICTSMKPSISHAGSITERFHAGKIKAGSELEIRKQQYTYSEVQSMTDNFSVVIGKGGSGSVYHGNIGDTQVAVKMLTKLSEQGDKEFQSEATLLLSIHHKNITSLIGYCNEGKHKGIIYEYMANGNLEMHLSDTCSSVLNWEERLQIGCDAAHGLEYLHHGCKPPIVHRDIKCNNILLNETFQAKLADFGLSKAFPVEGGTHISTVIAGTPGYLDPE
ncbi:leucine-rich repeat transmembrane protein kinase protein [Artemisia annua]|uniref:non-specific serine/threonine protein kinase n=1 Tax=Artemisia annua TaxID=35608 RepID=A0A2U1MET9_ARTAN|nr:leucine-rich repeat transmembrane protein kinase protein [Artemisia annua]